MAEQPTTEQPYTEADVAALGAKLQAARTVYQRMDDGYLSAFPADGEDLARVVLDALAAAGRLREAPKPWHRGIDSSRDAHQQMFPTHRITTSQDPYGWVCWGAVSEQCSHEIATVNEEGTDA